VSARVKPWLASIFGDKEKSALPPLLRDVFVKDTNKQTFIEVHSDSIHIREATEVDDRIVPLEGLLEKYDTIAPEIREHIAGRIAKLLPELAGDDQDGLMEYVIKVIEMMAKDQLPRVRQMIAEELKDTPHAPKHLIQQLANDASLEVAAPILEYSPLLCDTDLIDIIRYAPQPGILEAIAKRKHLSADISDAIVRSNQSAAISMLLNNDYVMMAEPTVEYLVEWAEPHVEIHAALCDRPELTVKTINRIANFVSKSLIEKLEARLKEDAPAAVKNVTKAIAGRLNSPEADRSRAAMLQAEEAHRRGLLDQDVVTLAMDRGNLEFVIAATALLSKIPADLVRKILNSGSPRSVTALAWKAGYSMRTAMQLQLRGARIPHTKILNAKDGQDYPISEAEMQEYLDHFLK